LMKPWFKRKRRREEGGRRKEEGGGRREEAGGRREEGDGDGKEKSTLRNSTTIIYLQLLHSDTLKDNDQKTEMLQLLSSFALPEKQDFEFGASYGLITLQLYNNFNIKKLAKGKILTVEFSQHRE
jgi:hypothetical protein